MTTKAEIPKNTPSKTTRRLDVELPAPPAERWDELPALELLVFNQRNRLVGRAPFERGSAHVDAELGGQRMLRGVVAPRGMQPLAAARSRSLPSQATSFGESAIDSLAFDPGWWENLLLGELVHFHGKVEKVIGESTLPIREGTVEIYEVDPWLWIVQQPDLELERFRDDLLRLLDPIPLPEPPPGPGPWPRSELLPQLDKLSESNLPMAATPVVLATPEDRAAQISLPHANGATAHSSLQSQLLSTLHGEPLRAYLNLNKTFLVPLLSLLLPEWWYRKDKLGEVVVQADGSFSGNAGWWRAGLDRPDLYFRVRQTIEGEDKTIYGPLTSCHTWWNYAGQEIVLRVTDPEAVAVQDTLVAEDNEVVLLGVGFDTTTDVAGAPGLVQSGPDMGLYRFPSGKVGAYGQQLQIMLDVDLHGLKAAGLSYFRLSYRRGRQTAVGNGSDWTPLTTPIHRHYREITMVGGMPVVSYPIVSLVPTPANLPTALAGIEGVFHFADPQRDYVVIDRSDRAFGIWDTNALPDEGQSHGDVADDYSVRLEVFDANGNDVTLNTPILRIHTQEADDSFSTTALSSATPFLLLHIDNRPMVAEIRDQILAGSTTTNAGCGFLVAAPDAAVEVGLRAFHPASSGMPTDPDRFIDSWRYRVTRGSAAVVRTDITVTDKNVGSPVGWYDVPGTPDIPLQTVDQLLNGVALAGTQRRCTFNVRLEARTLTRNGYGRLHTLDSSDTAAFALIARN